MSVIVHVGYPKTASTWLQTRVFPAHPALDYWRDVPGFDWVNKVVNLHDFDFNAKALGERYRADRDSASARLAVISLEGLVGDVFAGGWDTCRNADRLRAVLGEARIIISIRAQVSMLDSLYKQYVAEGGFGSVKSFLGLRPAGRAHFSLNYLRYDRAAGYYRALFGEDSVYVCLYEELLQSPDAFLRGLSDFLGIDGFDVDQRSMGKKENPGFSAFSTAVARVANRFLHSDFNPLPLVPPRLVGVPGMRAFLKRADTALFGRLFPAKSVIDQNTRVFLEDYYRSGNRALAGELGLPLAKYGYPL